MGKINGDLMIMQIDGYTIAGQKNGGASFNSDMLDATAKDSGGDKEYIAGWRGHTFTLESLYNPDAGSNVDFSSLFTKWKAGTLVTLKWGETATGRKYYTASALINKIDLNGPANQLSSYSLSLQGTGAVTEATVGAASTDAEFTFFSFPTTKCSTTITSGAGTIAVGVTTGTVLTSLIATFGLSAGASAKIGAVAQVSGVTSNSFSASKTYRVTAADGVTTKDWTVTVTANL